MKEIKLAIFGLGNVGSALISSLEKINSQQENKFNIIGVSAQNKQKKRNIEISQYNWIDNPLDFIDKNKCDVVVELIGNEKGISYEIVKKSLENKINVVTANKALLAKHGNELFNLSDTNNVNLLFEASVAGGIPIINILKNSVFLNKIKNISGILNGTTNFILTKMEEDQLSFDEALKIAKENGYAETDPSNDIEGIDSAYKITILASLCYGIKINHSFSSYSGVNNFDKEDIKYSKMLGYRIKLISEASIIEDQIYINTSPKLVNLNNPLAHVRGVLNAINIETNHLKSLFIEGEGAGGIATSSSVIGDLYEISRNQASKSFGYLTSKLFNIDNLQREKLKRAYYFRILVKDQPGVLSKITSYFTSKNISIQTIFQLTEEKINNKVPIILTTYETYEKDIDEVKLNISNENFLEDNIITLTIQN